MSDMKQCDKCKKMMYEDSRSDKGDYCTVKIDYVDGFSIYHLCKTCYRQFLTEFTRIMTAEEYDDHYGTWWEERGDGMILILNCLMPVCGTMLAMAIVFLIER